jgi:dienelactone hydrolase
MATWQYGIHALPAHATISGNAETFKSSPGKPPWTKQAEKKLKPGVKLPAALYLHGCSGFSVDAVKYRRFMLSRGYAVFMPDSYQRPGRQSCGDVGPMDERIAIRKEEVGHALSEIRQMSWVDQNRVVLMGFSEGGNTTDNWDEKGFAAHIVLGSACTETGTGMPAAPKGTPVLAIVGERDPHRPGLSCHMERTVGGSKSISLPNAGHRIGHRRDTKRAIARFLRTCCT